MLVHTRDWVWVTTVCPDRSIRLRSNNPPAQDPSTVETYDHTLFHLCCRDPHTMCWVGYRLEIRKASIVIARF